MRPRALVRAGCLVAFVVLATTAAAQEVPADGPEAAEPPTLYARMLDVPLVKLEEAHATRPAVLPVLYAGFVALEAYDGYTTSRGLAAGRAELNPFVRWAVDHPLSLWALKGAAAAGSIYVAERLWRGKRRGQAITVMVLSNAIIGIVAVRNTAAIHGAR